MTDYNYADFDMEREQPAFRGFPGGLGPGERAPDFPLEDLETGETVHLKELWAKETVVIEFGSFT
jgi:hypothetical protein